MGSETTDDSEQESVAQEPAVAVLANNLRAEIEVIKPKVLNFANDLKSSDFEVFEGENRSEQIANVILAYRHLQDAKMKLGLVLEATFGPLDQ